MVVTLFPTTSQNVCASLPGMSDFTGSLWQSAGFEENPEKSGKWVEMEPPILKSENSQKYLVR